MQIDRSKLLEALDRVAPALSAKDFIPIFAYFCFDKKRVTTYDDQVGMTIPCEWPQAEGVRGSTLLGWLKASRGSTVEVVDETEKGERTFKCGKSRLRLGTLSEFVFTFPEDAEADTTIKFSGDLLAGIQRCLISLGRDPSNPSRCGMTVTFGETTRIYSTNNATASMARVKEMKVDSKVTALLLPWRFCELVAQIGNSDTPKSLLIGKKGAWIVATFESGLRLFSKLSTEVNASQYEDIFAPKTLKSYREAGHPIPKGLNNSMERVMVVLATSKDPNVKLTLGEGKLILTAKAAGDLRDSLKMPGAEAAEAFIRGSYLMDALKDAEDATMTLISGKVLVFTESNFVHMISAGKGSEK